LKKIKQRTLVVNGKDDIMAPTINSYILQQHLPDARLILYPDSGPGSHFQFLKSSPKRPQLEPKAAPVQRGRRLRPHRRVSVERPIRLSLAGDLLVIPDPALRLPVLRALSLCACCRHYPDAAAGRRPRSSHPAAKRTW
jgi:hypothetical protein